MRVTAQAPPGSRARAYAAPPRPSVRVLRLVLGAGIEARIWSLSLVTVVSHDQRRCGGKFSVKGIGRGTRL